MNSIAYRVGGYADYVETSVANTCRSAGGDLGGGFGDPYRFVCCSSGKQVTGPICARDWKGVGNEYVNEGKVVVMFCDR